MQFLLTFFAAKEHLYHLEFYKLNCFVFESSSSRTRPKGLLCIVLWRGESDILRQKERGSKISNQMQLFLQNIWRKVVFRALLRNYILPTNQWPKIYIYIFIWIRRSQIYLVTVVWYGIKKGVGRWGVGRKYPYGNKK